VPFSVADTLGVALVESDRVPAVTVAVAVTFEATAEEAAASAIAATTRAGSDLVKTAFVNIVSPVGVGQILKFSSAVPGIASPPIG
jgi:hypothetical protein